MSDSDKDKLIDYFITHTNERLSTIDHKIDKLIQFKWQIIGGAGILSIVLTVCIQLIFVLIKG